MFSLVAWNRSGPESPLVICGRGPGRKNGLHPSRAAGPPGLPRSDFPGGPHCGPGNRNTAGPDTLVNGALCLFTGLPGQTEAAYAEGTPHAQAACLLSWQVNICWWGVLSMVRPSKQEPYLFSQHLPEPGTSHGHRTLCKPLYAHGYGLCKGHLRRGHTPPIFRPTEGPGSIIPADGQSRGNSLRGLVHTSPFP